ncbi:MAG TPA: hypothetical protein VF510_16310 [Ktedonobacterales bacterium]
MSITRWSVEPSLPYEMLCFLNVLTSDPFYTTRYEAEYEHWRELMPANVTSAVATIKRVLKDERQTIISAKLCNIFSALPHLTVGTLRHVLSNRGVLFEAYCQSPYYTEEDWQAVELIWDDVRTVLTFLEMQDFVGYWERVAGAAVSECIERLTVEAPAYDIVPEVEARLGFQLPSPEITVYVVYFTQPHGMKLVGPRFITSPRWPLDVTLRTAIHEMMHPPFPARDDAELNDLIAGLTQDAFLMNRFEGHNPSFGYNTLVGLIEEDCVQALDQIISERFGVGRDPSTRWQASDDGLHVFAVALYALMRQEPADARWPTFRDYLVNALRTTLRPGRIEALYRQVAEA